MTLTPNPIKANRKVTNKMKKLSPFLGSIVDNQIKDNNLHVIKWIDEQGYINVAFQIIRSHQLNNDKNPIHTSSLVFAQNEKDDILMSLYQNINDGLKSRNVKKVLGTYDYEELTEPFILDKINQFLDFEAVG